MKNAKKGQNAHKTGETSKKDSKKNKRKKQGLKQIKQTVSMKNRIKFRNKQKIKKCIGSLVKNSESNPHIVTLKKYSDANSDTEAKQELSKITSKKPHSTKHKKLRKKKINNAQIVHENVKLKSNVNQKEQKVTRSEQKQKAKVHKLRVLIEKRIREEEKADTLTTEQEIDNLRDDSIVTNNQQENEITTSTEVNSMSDSQKHQQPQSLRDRMMARLKASRFRFINQGLYTSNSSESKNYFKEDPDAFKAYHEGYKQQVERWPVNPLDVIISSIQKLPKDYVIADLGCGEGRLATAVPHKVHSFDLVSINDWVKACDVTHTPLLTGGVHVVVFCLSLMGTNLDDYIFEANRVLRKDGILKIAEVESRFNGIDEFINVLSEYGFTNTWKDLSHNLFYFMDFKKIQDVSSKTNKLPPITLKPCFYKKR